MSDFCIKCEDLGEPHFRFRINRPIQSQNVISGNSGGMRWMYGKERKAWADAFASVLESGRITKAEGRRVIRITREYAGRKREMDYGNLVGGAKLIIDAMQREIGGKKKPIPGVGIIIDDSNANFIGVYRQERSFLDSALFEVWDYPQK